MQEIYAPIMDRMQPISFKNPENERRIMEFEETMAIRIMNELIGQIDKEGIVDVEKIRELKIRDATEGLKAGDFYSFLLEKAESMPTEKASVYKTAAQLIWDNMLEYNREYVNRRMGEYIIEV